MAGNSGENNCVFLAATRRMPRCHVTPPDCFVVLSFEHEHVLADTRPATTECGDWSMKYSLILLHNTILYSGGTFSLLYHGIALLFPVLQNHTVVQRNKEEKDIGTQTKSKS
jgi:hypothetical protein